MKQLVEKELGLQNIIVSGPFATMVYSAYVDGKLDPKGGIRTNFIVKVGENAAIAESASGKFGVFVQTFEKDKSRKPVIILENKKLEDVKTLAQKLSRSISEELSLLSVAWQSESLKKG